MNYILDKDMQWYFNIDWTFWMVGFSWTKGHINLSIGPIGLTYYFNKGY